MAGIYIQQWDAFAEMPFKGNPAAVVAQAQGLPDEAMQRIAREMNLSETAFVTPSTLENHRFRYRWFTPTDEVEFCGHATLAATYSLCDQGIVELPGNGSVSFQAEARIGTLELTVESVDGRAQMVWIGAPLPAFDPYEGEPLWEFLTAMDLTVADLEPSLEPWACSSHHMLYIPLNSLEVLGRLNPDFRKLGMLGTETKLSAVPFTLETFDPKHRIHLRCFAPSLGVDEDPVTGSANSPLGVLLFLQGVLPQTDNPAEYIAEQGDFVNRSGRVRVRVHHQGGLPTAIQIGGAAAKVMEGQLFMNM
jgi:trans-2,3-dihydro-3-hydroxyanthranilate isomerase